MERAGFEIVLLQDLSFASGLPVECFEVDDVLPGSVIVQVGVCSYLVTSSLPPSPTFYLCLDQCSAYMREQRFDTPCECIITCSYQFTMTRQVRT